MGVRGPIPYLTGPTACGKSAVALLLAELIGAEIVSADSRQMYREMSIATARPTDADVARVPHHLAGDRSAREPMSAGSFAREASDIIRGILGRGGVPLIVGGSTLYLQALVFGLSNTPDSDPDVRVHLAERLEREGADVLYRDLLEVDPQFAATLDSTKTQRIIRGLEVHRMTGRPLSSFFDETLSVEHDFRVFVLHRDRKELYRRIDDRVDVMLRDGLVMEARALAEAGFDLEANPLRTIGYPETAGYLRGEYGEDELRRRIQTNSRRYAKRQLTWLRRYPEFEWIDMTGRGTDDVAVDVSRRIGA